MGCLAWLPQSSAFLGSGHLAEVSIVYGMCQQKLSLWEGRRPDLCSPSFVFPCSGAGCFYLQAHATEKCMLCRWPWSDILLQPSPTAPITVRSGRCGGARREVNGSLPHEGPLGTIFCYNL